MEQFFYTHTLSNGLRVALLPIRSCVVYCGFGILSGSRNDPEDQHGLAHFVEHMLFKGTQKRRLYHINTRMELVGGELNAYTTKEETYVYTSAPRGELVRSMELLNDLVRHSTFPERELLKERVVVEDEINLYKDTPAEQIYDDFEAQMLGAHPLAHPILGSRSSLRRIGSAECMAYAEQAFRPERMLFFCMGQVGMDRFVSLCEHYLCEPFGKPYVGEEHGSVPASLSYQSSEVHRTTHTHQSHTIIGGPGYDLHDPRRTSAAFVLNMLGGQGMNARLNLLLREKHGWVYGVEASHTALTDTGWWEIYFGSDPAHAAPALEATLEELRQMGAVARSDSYLRAWKKQACGQLAMASENSESTFLAFGRQMMHYGVYESLSALHARIQSITAAELMDTSRTLFSSSAMSLLVYEGRTARKG